MEAKKELVTQRLNRLQEERQAKLEKNRQDRGEEIAVKEAANQFSGIFNGETNRINEMLDNCRSVETKLLSDRFDAIAESMEKLNKFLADSTLYLPSYEIRQSRATLSKLQNQVDITKDELMPKKKFTFKSRKKVASSNTKLSDTPASDTSKDIVKNEDVVDTKVLAQNLCDYSNLDSKELDIGVEEILSKDIKLSHLRHCTVRLCGYASALHMDNLTQCTIISGPISFSVFADKCIDCKIVVACQQLRVHSSHDTQFYIGVTSRAIIEDCTRLTFAPYTLSYPSMEDHFKSADLDRVQLNWSNVDDFNWLRIDQPSPNWSILPENDRITQWRDKKV